MHSQYGGSSISVIDKALSRGPNFPLECLPLIYAVMQATHFLLILWGFLTLFTVGLPSFQPKAAFSILFLVPFVFQHVFTLGRQIKCWIHFFISFYLLICAKHASLCKVTLCGCGLPRTFCLAESHKGRHWTAVTGVVSSPSKADGTTSATACVHVWVCVCSVT